MTTLTMKDEKRLETIHRVHRGDLTVTRPALVMGISERQCLSGQGAGEQGGAQGVVHGNRGRPCKRRIKEKTFKRNVELAKGKYKDFCDHDLTEKLEEQEKIKLCREKVRLLLRAPKNCSLR